MIAATSAIDETALSPTNQEASSETTVADTNINEAATSDSGPKGSNSDSADTVLTSTATKTTTFYNIDEAHSDASVTSVKAEGFVLTEGDMWNSFKQHAKENVVVGTVNIKKSCVLRPQY